MPKKLANLDDLFEHELRDLYSAEKQLIAALPKMAKAASNATLKKAFQKHLEETRAQKERLDQIFEMLGIKSGGKKCLAMEGLIEEGKELIDEDASPETKDAGLIASAQRIEHYEISGYGTAANYAEKLGNKQVAKLLTLTLKEEQKTDTKLNDLAKKSLNDKALARSRRPPVEE